VGEVVSAFEQATGAALGSLSQQAQQAVHAVAERAAAERAAVERAAVERAAVERAAQKEDNPAPSISRQSQ